VYDEAMPQLIQATREVGQNDRWMAPSREEHKEGPAMPVLVGGWNNVASFWLD